jgi:hypothetical protein
MKTLIETRITEVGMNNSLFGDPRIKARRVVREDESDAELQRSAGGDETPPSDAARRALMKELHEAVDGASNASKMLREMDERETYSRAGVGGAGGRSEESLKRWAAGLFRQGGSLLESRGLVERRWGG